MAALEPQPVLDRRLQRRQRGTVSSTLPNFAVVDVVGRCSSRIVGDDVLVALGLERINDRIERLVLDLDQLGQASCAISREVAMTGTTS